MQDYTPDPNNPGWSYTGDPGQESNWIYDPPGQQADPNQINLEPDGQGGWTGYDLGETAPVDAPQYSTDNYENQPPTEKEQQNAVAEHARSVGLPWPEPMATLEPGVAAAPIVDVARTKAAYQAAQAATQALEDKQLAALQAGNIEEVQRIGTQLTIARQRENRALVAWQEAEAGKLGASTAQSNRQKAEEDRRRFGVTEARLSARDRALAVAEAERNRVTALGQRGAGETAQAQREAARERLAQEERLAGQAETAKAAAAERSQRVALATALMNMSTGPNGPANRKMALELLAGLGVNTGALATGGGGTPPNLISPAIWDGMSPGAQRILMDAWVAQGGDPKDFLFSIDAQRPQGRPSAPARVRYAAPVGA